MQSTDATSTANAQLAVISRFCTQLAIRPDGAELRAKLAAAFVDHHSDLWPFGDPSATPQWVEGHVDEILATVERLYQQATCGPVAQEFLDRMAWLPPLLKGLDRPLLSLDG